MAKRRSTDLLSGTSCVDPKTKGLLGLRYLILRIDVYLANDFLNFFLRKMFGKNCCPINTLGVKLSRKFRLNLLILLFRRELCSALPLPKGRTPVLLCHSLDQ
jgi:hypothetical protein